MYVSMCLPRNLPIIDGHVEGGGIKSLFQYLPKVVNLGSYQILASFGPQVRCVCHFATSAVFDSKEPMQELLHKIRKHLFLDAILNPKSVAFVCKIRVRMSRFLS